MLFRHVNRLFAGGVLPTDYGHLSHRLAATLDACGIQFCMCVEKACNAASHVCATLYALARADYYSIRTGLARRKRVLADDVTVGAWAPRSNGKVPMSTTDILALLEFPYAAFGNLNGQRWHVEKAFKSLEASSQPRSRHRPVTEGSTARFRCLDRLR
jgi:hypothetical protein